MHVRESHSAAAHQFFALARLFMVHHPVAGASEIAIRFGDYSPYQPGWNVKHDPASGDRYVWIDPGGRDGLTTRTLPLGVDRASIRQVPLEPPFDGSEAEKLFNRAVAALSIELNGAGHDADIFRIHHDIRQFAACDDRRCSEMADDLYHRLEERLEERLRRTGGDPSAVIDAARALIRNYLVFTVPGVVARVALARYLVSTCRLTRSVDDTPTLSRFFDRLGAVFFRFREQTGTLLAQRAEYDLTSFYEMTFLAGLLGDVALIIGRGLLEAAETPAELRTRISTHQRNLDEVQAYDVLPAFLYPALLLDYPIRGELRFARRTPRVEPFRYPQLAADHKQSGAASVFAALAARTAALPAFNIEAFLADDDRFVDEETRATIAEQLRRSSGHPL